VTLTSADSTAIRPQEANVDLVALRQAVESAGVTRDEAGLTATIEVPAPGWVWIDRAWWPAWQATVDGVGVPVAQAMGGQLIHVDAGRHVIRQWLLPWEAILGLVIGVATLGFAALWLRGSRAIRSAGVA
jgi:hypothetical protein